MEAPAEVAPSRGRELKQFMQYTTKEYRLVAPSRGRELKPAPAVNYVSAFKSLPHGGVN